MLRVNGPWRMHFERKVSKQTVLTIEDTIQKYYRCEKLTDAEEALLDTVKCADKW